MLVSLCQWGDHSITADGIERREMAITFTVGQHGGQDGMGRASSGLLRCNVGPAELDTRKQGKHWERNKVGVRVRVHGARRKTSEGPGLVSTQDVSRVWAQRRLSFNTGLREQRFLQDIRSQSFPGRQTDDIFEMYTNFFLTWVLLLPTHPQSLTFSSYNHLVATSFVLKALIITLMKTIPPNQISVLNSQLSEHFTEYSTSFSMRSENATPDPDSYLCAYVATSTTIAPTSPAYTWPPQHPRFLCPSSHLTGSKKGGEYRLSPPTPPWLSGQLGDLTRYLPLKGSLRSINEGCAVLGVVSGVTEWLRR